MKKFLTIAAVVVMVTALAIVGFTDPAGNAPAPNGQGHGHVRGGQHGQMDPAQRWQHMLERLDTNKDGKISKDEFPGRDEVFDRIDANGDGFITEDEAAAIGNRRGGGQRGQMDPAQRWQRMLERQDTNKDGKISKDEFPGRDEVFDRIDANGDGFITEDEAAAMGNRRGGGQRGGLIARMDQDGDGKVTREEWAAAFDKLDTNGDGVLDQQDRPQRGGQGGPRHGGQGGPNA
ncbi:MAG: EF-hand domain-containing protein [Armatimonadetes bacterium]|nr:EF-hand domain-containing protein [Armatimonadota bacterium]